MSASDPHTGNRRRPRAGLLIAVTVLTIAAIVLLVLLRPGGPATTENPVSTASANSPASHPVPQRGAAENTSPTKPPASSVPGSNLPAPGNSARSLPAPPVPADPNAPAPHLNAKDLPPDHPPIEDEGA